jgi:hypothetical protein
MSFPAAGACSLASWTIVGSGTMRTPLHTVSIGRSDSKTGNHLGLVAILLLCALLASGCGSGTSGGSLPPVQPPDFSLMLGSQSLTVLQGSSANVVVSIMPLNGGVSSVSVAIGGLPAGVTTQPSSPFNLAESSPQTVTLFVSDSTPPGNYTITFEGSTTTLQHSASAVLQVQPLGLTGFSVSLNNSELTFAQGGSANTIVGLSLNTVGSGNFTVVFSVSGLPNGVQAVFGLNPFPFNSPATSLQFTASPIAALANYAKVTVIATRTADGLQESAALSINVTPPVGTLPPIRTDFVRMDGAPAAAVYDSVHDLVYASNPQWNRVDVISPATHQIVKSISVPSATAMDMSLDGTRVVVTSNVQQIVSIDTTSLQVVQRTSVPPLASGGDSYEVPALIANTSNGTSLIGMTLDSSPPAYYLEQWDPVAGTFTHLAPPGITAWINHLARTGDGKKALVVDYGSDVNIAIYDATSNSFPVSGASPVGGVLGVAGSPTAEQFAIIGGNGFVIVDSSLNVLGTIPVGGIYWGMTYSLDGTRLYVTMTIINSSATLCYPVIATVDTSTYSVLGVAPAFQTPTGNSCPFTPYFQATPLAADNTGLLYSSFSHGMVLDDSANFRNLLTLPGGPPPPQMGFVDEAPLNTSLATGLGNVAFDVPPDIWVGNTRGTGIQWNEPTVSFTGPPSATPGMVNVKAVLPDGWFSLAAQSFSYGSQILFLGGNAASAGGGAMLAIIGYGLVGNNGAAPTVIIGGTSAKVTASTKYVDINDSGFNITYPFADVDEVLVQVPAESPGTVDVTVTSTAGTATMPKSFTYIPSVNDYATPDSLTFVLYDLLRHRVYLSAGNHVDVFSADTNQFLAPINPPAVNGSWQIRGLALTPDNSKLLVANYSDLSLAIVDLNSPTYNAKAVQVVPNGIPNGGGPYAVAVTSTNEAFVTTGSNQSAPVYVLDLSTLQVTTPFNSLFSGSGTSLWAPPSGDHVLMGNALWSAATNQWTFGLRMVGDSIGVSADGYWFASDYTRLDSQMIQRSQTQPPEFFASLLSFVDWPGEKMNASGSLLYTPVPIGTGKVESNGIDITDTNHGTWLGHILLTESIEIPGVQSAMDLDEAGGRIFLITNKGLTVVPLPTPPLSIGYLVPATGLSAGGTAVTIRGSGFDPGATVSFGGTSVSATVVDKDTLQVVTPTGTVGGTNVSVQNPDGTSYSLDAGFVYQ